MSHKQNSDKKIVIKGACEHNLKNIDLEIPRNKLVVFTGLSGSGKSSLVFDTIYAEGQRRYVESLSSYARQFLERINKPKVDLITGISPAVAIEQKTGTKNNRSTVGTSTEVYDYLRLLFARIGVTYCFICGKPVTKASTGTVVDFLETQEEGSRFYLTFPLHQHEGRTIEEELELLKKRGFFRIVYQGKDYDLNDDVFTPDNKDDIRVLVQRFKITKSDLREKLADSIESAFREGENRIILIGLPDYSETPFNKLFECCGTRYEEPESRFFSFNNPKGACPVCQGFSKVYGLDMKAIVPNPNLSLLDGAIAPWKSIKYSSYLRALVTHAYKYKIPLDVPFKKLDDGSITLIKRGTKDFKGIDQYFEDLQEQTHKMHIRVLLARYRGYTECSACKGSRLRREALQVKIQDKSIYDIVTMPLSEAYEFFSTLKLTQYEQNVADQVIKEVIKRLLFLNDVGLGYLTLDRLSSTLSGGETQRINLATALGSALVGALYVLDEPSIGLHPRDNTKLISVLKNLRDIGNTLLVVEHDPEMMSEADLIVDIGPGAGEHGGSIMAKGTPKEIMNNPESITGNYLSGRKSIEIRNREYVASPPVLSIKGAYSNNLKNVSTDIPLSRFVVVTGVSGSGKSTLVHDVVYGGVSKLLGVNSESSGLYESISGFEYIDHVEIVDQSPIGKSPRSNPVSYIKAYELIRDIFASTHQAKLKGFGPGYFSFNIPGGRCETCQGDGFIKVEMQFLADLYLTCEDCGGTRFKKEIREVLYRGKNIVDVLDMSVAEALTYFEGHKKLLSLLQLLADVGLSYLKLGQPSNTLSGGEAQRIKLAQHLAAKRDNKHTLFIFDEPTTGLHFEDINKLLTAFEMLLKSGNSLLIIEHNLDVIKNADYIIDLGPEAGAKGGEIVVVGTPADIMACSASHTGRYLKQYLGKE